jgi:hypothetical protein
VTDITEVSALDFLEEQIAIFDLQIRQSIDRQSLSEPDLTTDSPVDLSLDCS